VVQFLSSSGQNMKNVYLEQCRRLHRVTPMSEPERQSVATMLIHEVPTVRKPEHSLPQSQKPVTGHLCKKKHFHSVHIFMSFQRSTHCATSAINYPIFNDIKINPLSNNHTFWFHILYSISIYLPAIHHLWSDC